MYLAVCLSSPKETHLGGISFYLGRTCVGEGDSVSTFLRCHSTLGFQSGDAPNFPESSCLAMKLVTFFCPIPTSRAKSMPVGISAVLAPGKHSATVSYYSYLMSRVSWLTILILVLSPPSTPFENSHHNF